MHCILCRTGLPLNLLQTLYMKIKLTVVLLLWTCYAQAQAASRYQVVMDEIMADPAPPVGLPNAEFIELKNTSAVAFNLIGWRLGDASTAATIGTNFILEPDSFVIICANSAAAAFRVYGNVIGVSNFPSLNNDAGQLYLRSREGTTIHAVAYASTWYQNPVKALGGWSLEMIDIHNPCSGVTNWTASTDPTGGTPGRKNTVNAIQKDDQAPVLLSAFANDSITITASFDEPLDSAASSLLTSYQVSDGVGTPVSAIAIAPFFNQVQLQTKAALQPGKIYKLDITNVADCAGNNIGNYHNTRLGLTVAAGASDIIINEILFNPKPDGADYVEIYNRSNLLINLKDCYIATRSLSGAVGTPVSISLTNRVLFPGEYAVITEDELAVKKQYLAKNPETFAVVNSLPSLPDDKGNLLLINTQGKLLDELSYDAHWHFALLGNAEGVALERIDYNKPTQDAANWHSAATSAGYGTPGYQNSQYRNDGQLPGSISISPPVFSPDNDGLDDFLTINYQFPAPGYVCNITVFDASGRPVCYITRNALCGRQGYFRWDGLDGNYVKLPIGVYVILTDVFNLQGKTRRFKQAVTLARRL